MFALKDNDDYKTLLGRVNCQIRGGSLRDYRVASRPYSSKLKIFRF